MKIINKFNETNIVYVYIKYVWYKDIIPISKFIQKIVISALLLHNSKANYTCHSRKSPYLNKNCFPLTRKLFQYIPVIWSTLENSPFTKPGISCGEHCSRKRGWDATVFRSRFRRFDAEDHIDLPSPEA